ncbi:protein of unknown function [Stenotrophomonas maltophilia]|nr:protein of unknown function [Stenotrophomonas maltophilia]
MTPAGGQPQSSMARLYRKLAPVTFGRSLSWAYPATL